MKVVRFVGVAGVGRRGNAQQFASQREAGLASGTGEQAVVPDAMEAAWQDMKQEAADELVGRQCHDLLAIGAVAAVVLVAESDAALVEGDQPAVRNRDPVSVAGQIGEHRLRSRERRLGVNHPALLPHGSKMAQECPPLDQVRDRPEEAEPARLVQRDQPGEKQATEQLSENPHREQEGRARRYPAASVRRDAAARHDHM